MDGLASRLRATALFLVLLMFSAPRPVAPTPTTPPKSYISPVHPEFPTITPPSALNAGELELALSILAAEERDSPIWQVDGSTMQAKREGGDGDKAPTSGQQPTLDALTGAPTSTATSSESTQPFPLAFDGAAAYNFTSGSPCPYFLNDLLLDDTFQACNPLSMLIMTSRGLFDAAKQLGDLVRVLDAACSISSGSCGAYLTAKAHALLADSNCGAEYKTRHPMVMQAYDGLRAYQMIYSATCLRDPATALYCYADAMTNLTCPDDAYMYFLPYNLSLPTSATPSCSWCTRSTLEVFRSAAADRSQAIADTYSEAASQVDRFCGGNFVSATLPVETSQAAFWAASPAAGLGVLLLGAVVIGAMV